MPLWPADNAYQSQLIQEAQEKKLAENPGWQKLLHMRKNLLTAPKSGIDDPHFFITPRGNRHPQAELEATLVAFFNPLPASGVDTQEHPQCRYPARYAWLKKQLAFDPTRMPEAHCDRFEAWRSQLNAQSVSLIFASYYMNNPASMYGHTFLRLNRGSEDPTAAQHLLDYTVNFAAEATTTNGILYAFYGLAGKFRGRFSTMPYYIKVQEYNNLESRDLWEYPLHLTPEQVDLLIRHLWELGQSSIAYYFFNRNCSYQLLPLLEAAAPELSLSPSFVFKTVPSDTLRALRQWPGFSDAGERRPSERSLLLTHRQRLTSAEIHLAEALLRPQSKTAEAEVRQAPVQRQALVLESAQELLRYRVGLSRDLPAPIQEKEQQLLLWRSQLGVSSSSVVVPPDHSIAPERSHRTGRISFSEGVSSRSGFQELSLRPALQDLDDSSAGYLSGSRLEMFNIRARYDDQRSKLYLEEFGFANIVSLPEWDRWVKKPAWKINAGGRVAHELTRHPESALYFGLNFGPGWSMRLPLPWSARFFLFTDVDCGAGHAWNAGGRFGGGGSGGLLNEFTPSLRLRLQAQHIHYWVGDPDSTTHLEIVPSWSITDRLDLRVILEKWNRYQEARFGLYWFL